MRIALLILLAAGVAVGVVLAMNGPGRAPVLTLIIVGAVLLAIIVPGVRSSIRKRRTVTATHLEELQAGHGFISVPVPDSKLHRRFGSLPGIPKGGDVKHALEGTVAGRLVTVFQHQYVIMTGQAVIPVLHSAYVTATPAWPRVKITRRGSFGRMLLRFGIGKGMPLDDPHFNRQCRVVTDDEDFALMLLHPEMQQLLAEKPSITWQINDGWCSMIYSGALRLDRVPASLARLERFWALVPPELDAWEDGPFE